MELARGGVATGPEVGEHLAECGECARFFEEQAALSAALRRVAAENAATRAPAEIEEHALAECRRARRGTNLWRPAIAAAVAAALAALVFLARGPASRPPAQAAAEPFVEIPFVAPLAPYERAEIQRMDVPVAALIAAGFEVHVPDPAGTVTADVLVGQDGRPHAIRLVSEVRR